jgi:hypothetical protein
MNVLLAHHLQPYWQDGLAKFGTDIYAECEKVSDYLSDSEIDKLIFTQFEYDKGEQSHDAYMPIFQVCEDKGIRIEWHEYGYAWELESFDFHDYSAALEKIEDGEIVEDNHGQCLALGGNHSSVVLIEDWQRQLAQHTVYLCGAFDGECIEDMQLALYAVNCKYKRLNHLIV